MSQYNVGNCFKITMWETKDGAIDETNWLCPDNH